MLVSKSLLSTIVTASAMGQVEAADIVEATADALAAYKQAHPTLEVVHIEIEDTVVMPQRRKLWEKGL